MQKSRDQGVSRPSFLHEYLLAARSYCTRFIPVSLFTFHVAEVLLAVLYILPATSAIETPVSLPELPQERLASLGGRFTSRSGSITSSLALPRPTWSPLVKHHVNLSDPSPPWLTDLHLQAATRHSVLGRMISTIIRPSIHLHITSVLLTLRRSTCPFSGEQGLFACMR
jgi:hypothetical protein